MLTPEHLSRLSALLDQALDLAPEQREPWLSALQGEDASLADTLRRMLARHASAETAQWLAEQAPSFTVPRHADGPPPEPFAAGQLIGSYRLLQPLGRGGMGEVWLAEPAAGPLKRQVALKLPLLAAHHQVLAQRLARERDILAALAHPHIARLYDAGFAEGGQPFLALEYVAGQPITAHCAEHGLDARARVQLLLQVMQAVQYAHANLVIHRDLKPSNVLVTDEGRAMLLDFGIAKLLLPEHDLAEETELTQLGGRALTLAYAAPEQVSGAPVSTATDVWALGVLLYELIAQRQPFKRESPRETERAVLEIDPPPPGPDADLATITLKALKKAPAERYATVNAFAEDLQRWLNHEAVLARPDSAWYRTRKFVGRHKAAVATAAGVLAIIVGASAVSIHQAQVAQAQTRIAQTEAQTARAVERFLEGILRANSGDQADPLKARQRTAKDLLDEGARRIATELDDAPQAKLKVLDTLSDMFEDTELFAEAIRLQKQRTEIALKVDGLGSPAHVHALARTAHLLVSDLQLDAAKQVLENTAAAVKAGRADDNALTAWYLAQAWLARHADPATGIEPAAQAVTLLRRQAPSARLVQALDHQGFLLFAVGRPADALSPLQESAALAGRADIGAVSTLAGTLISLAEAQTQLGHLAEAELAFGQAVERSSRHHGTGSEMHVTALLQYGQFLANRGRIHEALQSHVPALEMLRAMPGSQHRASLLAHAIAIAGLNFVRAGRLGEIQALIDEALASPGDQALQPVVITELLNTRSLVRTIQGHWPQADEDLARAGGLLDSRRDLPAWARNNWLRYSVLLDAKRRQFDAAQATLDAWLADRRAKGVKDVEALEGRYLGCVLRVAREDREGAVPRCEDAMAYTAPAAERCHCATRADEVALPLAQAYLLAGRPGDAVKTLRDAVSLLQQRLGPEPGPRLLQAQALLAQAQLAAGDVTGARDSAAAARAIATAHVQLAPDYTEPLRDVERALARRR